MATSADHDDLITHFCSLTGAGPEEAQQYLSASQWDLSGAATVFYASQEAEAQGESSELQASADYTGPRTLDGRPAPQSIPTVGSSSRGDRASARGGINTLGSMNQASGHGHAHDDDDDDDEDYHEPDEQPRDLFAGGEKSGLAVQDPKRDPKSVVNDLIKKAKANTARPGGEPAAPSRFRGTGMTLGGDGTESQAIEDPNASRAADLPAQVRVLNIWNDGWSIEDGPLRRFDDPQHAADLRMIRQGRAPVHLMDVRPDQPVDVHLKQHETDYVAPKKVYKPFGGGGQRLGSPTPGGSGSSSNAAPAPAAPAAATASSVPSTSIDDSQPTLSLRIQLANGTRLPARFNTTQTIGDVYNFISLAHPGSNERAWVLATTFPNKDHTDKDAVLGELPEFKKGGTAVQKWV